MFDLDADMAAVHAVLGQDPLLARALARRPGLRVPCGWDGFEVAVRAILGQQISVAAATTIAGRLVTACGGVFPTPEVLADARLETLGVPKTRSSALRALARAARDGRIDFRSGQRLDDFVTRLVALPGIGPWTAHYLALRGLGHPDAFPAGDLVLQQILGRGRRLTERETEARSQRWRPWRAYAVLQLWHVSGDRRKERS
jgi:AraC family transcriptional regulator of adaptative response / DNA-3-methyladenine glycosylase II